MFAMTPHVKNRMAGEHVGKIKRSIWSDPEQPVSILELQDGHVVVVEELPESFAVGQLYRFMGRWADGKRGPQFKANSWIMDTPCTKHALTLFLEKSCTGIGKKKAAQLWDKYGADALDVLRNTPEKVAEDKLLSLEIAQEASRDLIQFAGVERTTIELNSLFAGRGFPQKLVNLCISRWGAKAPEIIRRNPYRLLVNRMSGCGWKRCDKLYLDLGGRRDALKRQFLAGYYALSGDRTGSTWVKAQAVVDLIAETVKTPNVNPIKALKLGLRAKWINLEKSEGQNWIATDTNADAERIVAESVRTLRESVEWAAKVNNWTALVEAVEQKEYIEFDRPSPHQIEQLKIATRDKIGCFTGGPGSGKTYTLSFLLREIIATHGADSVAVAAPTGKAAVRATEALQGRGLSIRATTLHKLLRLGGQNGKDESYNHLRPLPYRFVIVDESSMIDTTLMSLLLHACSPGTHVLLVGDPHQLPPVGHGKPFSDLIKSGVVGVGQLTEIRRNAGTIVRACESIKKGEAVQFAESKDLEADDPKNLLLIPSSSEDVAKTIIAIVGKVTKFDVVEEVQVITALNNKSEASRTKLNELLAKLINQNGERVEGCPFANGDKVICTSNGDQRAVEKLITGGYKVIPNQHHYIANGEMGRVVHVSATCFVVDWGADRVCEISLPKRKGKDSEKGVAEADEGREEKEESESKINVELGYAITVHRSQGSEWPLVIIAVDQQANMIADRNFWYTAISRAKKLGLVVGPESTFRNQCQRINTDKRKTLLIEKLIPLIQEI